MSEFAVKPSTISRCCCNHADITKIDEGSVIAAGNPVIIDNQGETFITVLWPSTAVPAGELHIPVSVCRWEKLSHSCRVRVLPIRFTIRYASRISVVLEKRSAEDPANIPLRAFLHQLLAADVRFVRKGQIIEFDYLGQPQQVTIEDLHFPDAEYCRIYFPPGENHYGDESNMFALGQSYAAVDFDTQVQLVTAKRKERTVKVVADEIDYSSVGGLGREIQIVRETIEKPLLQPEVYRKFGMRPPRGVLLYGPPGTGKTLIARTVAKATGAHCIVINGAEVTSKYFGETESRLRDLFMEAKLNAPSLIFIDEIDALCPKRDQSNSETEKRVVATLLTLMDGVDQGQSKENFIVIGATNRPNAVDPALRRPGRLDVEIEIGIPNAHDRLHILRIHLQKMPTEFTDEQLKHIADTTHGYVGADLAAMCREAGLRALKRGGEKPAVVYEDLLHAKQSVPPSAMREIAVEVPNVRWSDIGGQEDVKQKLRESIEWPLKYPEVFARLGLSPPKGILLYGPPGCSKTMMAKALATESGLNFIAVKGPELFNKYVGESERALREVFRKARAASPSILFFDEIDAIASSRSGMKGGGGSGGGSAVSDRVLTLLLTELDGFETLTDVTLVCATNLPSALDPALLRPGRIDRMIFVSPPDQAARLAILKIRTRKMPLASDVDFDWIAENSDGMSGAEVSAIPQEAAMFAIQQDPLKVTCVEMQHFRHALKGIRPQITEEMLEFYRQFGQAQGARNVKTE